jgi:hypothetical protein
MKNIEIQPARRWIRRKINMAMKKSYTKALAELICNSDESYQRLEKLQLSLGSTTPTKKPIWIYVTRANDNFEVVDWGEGLTIEKMEQLFRGYGDEKVTHTAESRALFGQGLVQALLSQKHGGIVRSIIDNKVHQATINWRKKNVDGKLDEVMNLGLKDPEPVTKEWRQELRIPQGNGTCVSFRYKSGAFPQKGTMISRISNFFILRLINTSPDREIRVVFLDKEGMKESEDIVKYSWPKGGKIGDLSTVMNHEGKQITIRGDLFRADDPLSQKEAGEERIGGLLLHDKGRVLDLTLFDFDSDPYARRFFGKMEIIGVYDLIREKLKSDDPEEILTDSRDGFNRDHGFTKHLARIVSDWLAPMVDNEKRSKAEDGQWDEATQSRTRKAFEILNKLYKEVNEEITGLAPDVIGEVRPENGIQFDRKTAEIEIERRYRIGLLIDLKIFPPGTSIAIASTNSNIDAQPPDLIVTESDDEKTLRHMSVIVKGKVVGEMGLVTAKVENASTSVQVSVVREERYYPPTPLEFKPKKGQAKPNTWGTLRLYVDTKFVPVGSHIDFLSSESEVMVSDGRLCVQEGDVSYNNVAVLTIRYRGTGEGLKATITARCQSDTAEADVAIRTSGPPPGGLFKDFRFEAMEGKNEAYFRPNDGIVRINLSHPLIQRYFSNDPVEARKRFATLPHCQVFVANLILSECLFYTFSKAYEENMVPPLYSELPWIGVKAYIDEHKSLVGKPFFDAFVRQDIIDKSLRLLQDEQTTKGA